MPGAALAIGVVACTAALAVGLTQVAAAAAFSQRLAATADAAALAAADAASGAVAGFPCERAAQIADAHGGDVVDCHLDGLIATITVAAAFGPWTATARARAGPAELSAIVVSGGV